MITTRSDRRSLVTRGLIALAAIWAIVTAIPLLRRTPRERLEAAVARRARRDPTRIASFVWSAFDRRKMPNNVADIQDRAKDVVRQSANHSDPESLHSAAL